jgi:beta-glucanase (GH16 family)
MGVATASAAPTRAGLLTRSEQPRARIADAHKAAEPPMVAFVVRRHIATRGFYSVRVKFIGRAVAGGLRVRVSRAPVERVRLRDRHGALAIRVWSHGYTLVLHIRGHLEARLRLQISARHLPDPDRSVKKHIATAGLYKVRVVVSTTSDIANHVKLKIGTTHYLVTARRNDPATVTAEMQLAASVLAVKASGSHTRPDMTVRLAKITAATPASAPPAAPTAAGPIVPTGVPGTWNLIFDDEFNGAGLNTADWSTGWFGSGITRGVSSNEPECYDPSHVAEANGELDLNFSQESESCNGVSQPYTSGMITTNGKFSFTYGLIEFRAWLPSTSNGQVADWPGLWTDGQDWPTDGEIDVAEGLGGSVCAHFHGPTDNGAGYGAGGITGCPPGTYTGGWHTFAADWEPGIVTWYYDGHDIGCISTTGSACAAVNTTITSSPMYIIMGLGSSSNAETAPVSLRVDYVRVWQH